MEFPNTMFVDVMPGSEDVPLQEVRILVMYVLTKQPRSAPCDCKVLHRNSRSGRYTHVEMSCVVTVVPGSESFGGPSAEEGIDRAEESRDDKRCEEWGEGASLRDALPHLQPAP